MYCDSSYLKRFCMCANTSYLIDGDTAKDSIDTPPILNPGKYTDVASF